MASATVDSTTMTADAATIEPPLQVDSLPAVDLRLLSQSELYSLSLCSLSTFDPLRCDDVVIPKIDRSVFNESAGSRKQTYSRLRLAPASAAAASASSIRSRTPHLRHTNNLPYQYLDTDPERAENREILALLKQLFGFDSSVCINEDFHEELVPVRVDYSHSVPQLVNDSRSVHQLANVGVTGQKRKRGRPRKNENRLVLIENKVESQCNNDNVVNVMNNEFVVYENVVNTTNNEIVVYQNVEDRDKDILNRDGMEVDLVALGAMEDPYGKELRQRTEGMITEEALLEFLKGVNGQWGSRRKKKRIVDASIFGNALPKGWALMLSIKKKEGHVWLFCRRYISPSGRQFVSCKEIASYLQSLRGIQGANQLTCSQANADIEVANSITVVRTVGEAVVDEKREMKPVCQISSSAVASTSSNFEVEVTLKTAVLPAVQVGEVLRCEKCNLTFNGQDDFLQHQLSSHQRRRSKNGESITDGVIIKDGKYECQICHKTFIERHRYNGHMGAHVRNQAKGSEETRATGVEESLGTGSSDLIPPGSMVKTSIGSERNVAAEFLGTNADDLLNSYLPHSIDKQNEDFKETNDTMGRVNEAMDVDTLKANLCLNSEAILNNNGNNECCGISGGANVIKRVANGIDSGINKSCDVQGMGFESCSPFPLDEKIGSTEKNRPGLFANMEQPQGEAVLGSVLLGSNENVGSCDIDLDDVHLSQTIAEVNIQGNKFVADVSISNFENEHDGLNVRSGFGDKQHCESGDSLCRNVDNVDGKSISSVSVDEQNIDSDYSMLAPSADQEKCRDNGVSNILPSTGSTVVRPENSEMYTLVNKESGNTAETNKDASTDLQEERGMGNCTVLPSGNVQVNFTKYNNEVSTWFLEGHKKLKDPEISLPSLSPFEENCGVEQYVGGASGRQMEEPRVNDVQNVRNNELIFPFSSSSNPMITDAVSSSKHERRLEFRSFFPSDNAGDNTGNVMEESRRQPPGNVLLPQSFRSEASHEAYNMNKIFAPQLDEFKLNNTCNSKNYDLCLASDSGTNCDTVQLERYPAENFDVQSGIKKVFGVQSNWNNVAHIGPENPREVRAFGIDLHDSAFSDRTCDFENNFNMIYPGKIWEGPKMDEVGNSGNKFIVGFDGSNPQPVEHVMSGSIWRAGEDNLLQTGVANPSTPLVQSSNCFRTFDIISEKGEEGLFGVDQNYDGGTGFEGLRLGRAEPVEYSFMTTQSSSSLPGDSKGLSYDVNTGQGFDSSFWLGKNALMPSVTIQNQVPTVCVWCRNEYYQEPISSGAQTGAIGSICPTCSSKISQQFNVL